MSGLRSRRKGLAAEYKVRDHLRQLGWRADRVPSSGAAEGFKGDIDAEHSTYGKMKFEVKSRKENFKKIYELYREHLRVLQDDVFAVAIPGGKRLCVAMSTSLHAILEPIELHLHQGHHPLYEQYKRTFAKIGNLQKLLGEAQILVIKDDRQPPLFIRFR